MSLDQRAGTATRELLEHRPPDTERMLDDLRRTRRQRVATRYAAAAVAVVLVAASWTLLQHDDSSPKPVGPGTLRNGEIVAPPAQGSPAWYHFESFGGELRLPEDAARFPSGMFTADGSELVYPSRQRTIKAIDVTTGSTRTLGQCLDEMCHPALSPDTTRLAYSAEDHLKIQEVATGDVRPLMTRGVQYPALPTWSPDGRTVAFVDAYGLYTIDVATEQVRRLHRSPERGQVFLAPAWSPDGHALVFLEQRPRPGSANHEWSFTVATVSADGGEPRELHGAGHCVCLGLPGPSVTWSPDGELIAVVVTQSADGAGIYTIRPDGSEWERLYAGIFHGVAWQPVPDNG